MWLNYHINAANRPVGRYKLLILRNKVENYCITLC